MQEHYAKKKQPAPYTTLAGFRRARRSDNLSPAFKAWRYRKADENQYERWKSIIGEENMPEDVDKFQELKYNKDAHEKYFRLQNIFLGYSRYKFDNPRATPKDYQKVVRLKEKGVKGRICIPPKPLNPKKYEFDDNHINNQRNHFVLRSEAESFIQQAVIAIVKWNGQVIQYFSADGATYVNVEKKQISTSFKSSEFDENVKKILNEVLKDDTGE